MINRLKQLVIVLGIAIGIGALAPAGAFAASPLAEQCANNPDASVCQTQNADPGALVTNIINTLLFVVGLIAVIMLIIGGIMYTTSAGDSGRVTTAKNTITFAIVGLVAAFLAFAIVQFVKTTFIK